MNSQRALFISGLVLGVGVGLMLSHVLIQHPHSAGDFAPRRIEILSRPDAIGMNQDSLLTRPFDETPYFEEMPAQEALQDPPPLQNALAVESTPEVLFQARNQLVPVQSPEPIAEPQPLPVGEVAPLSKNSNREKQTIQGIIELELGHLSPEKRNVWYEALKDVKQEDVAGILKMWKMLGGPIPEAPMGLPLAVPAPADEPGSAAQFYQQPLPGIEQVPPAAQAFNEAPYREAIAVHLRNLRRKETPGSVREIPSLHDPASENGRAGGQCQVRLDLKSFRIVKTDFPLDLAAQDGFLRLEDEKGEHYFVRSGRFLLNDGGLLVLQSGDRVFTLMPKVSFDAEKGFQFADETENKSASETVLKNMPLYVPLSSIDFEQVEAGLFRLTISSTGKRDSPRTMQLKSGLLKEGHLLFPEISTEQERAAISELDQLRNLSKQLSSGSDKPLR